MKWIDRSSVTEMDRGGLYEMDGQQKYRKNGNTANMNRSK